MKRKRLAAYIRTRLADTWKVFVLEIRRVLRDPGVFLIFFVAGLGYPILYNLVYLNNTIKEVPVAVVDMSCSSESREFIYRWDASQEVEVRYSCTSMEEAEQLLKKQLIHGILYIPSDYAAILNTGLETAHLSLYCDMSSFLYMKNVYMSANMVMLDKMNNIQVDRYEKMNVNHEMSWALVQSVPYEAVALYNPTGGYGAFLIPGVLMLILHQTLFLGIAMLCGTAREENKEIFILPGRRRRYSIFRLLIGRALAYFTFYFAIAAFDLILIPRLFDLPHVGRNVDILVFVVPFLLSTIFFSLLCGSFQKERETGMVTGLFSSLIFMFISGLSWPRENMSFIWQILGDLLPSTWGIHGYIHINTMGATLLTTIKEYNMLWLLTGFYFVLCVIVYTIRARKYDTEVQEQDARLIAYFLSKRDHLRQISHELIEKEKQRIRNYREKHRVLHP